MKHVKKFTRLLLLLVFTIGSIYAVDISFQNSCAECSYRLTDKQDCTYWINSATNVRHNSKCRWYKNTKRGYCTDEKIGRGCKICGG